MLEPFGNLLLLSLALMHKQICRHPGQFFATQIPDVAQLEEDATNRLTAAERKTLIRLLQKVYD